MKKGLFISFEGMDGSGKSTQIQRLKEYLEKKGCRVILTREPGGTPIGEKIRDIILDRENREMRCMTEALLYAASRAQHVEQVIKPALEEGKVVICDRFVDSSIAYQGYGRSMGNAVEEINRYAVAGCMPDVTFLMRVPPETGSGRIEGREKDRIEMEPDAFHTEVYRGYEALAERWPQRIVSVDASGSVDDIEKIIRGYMKGILDI